MSVGKVTAEIQATGADSPEAQGGLEHGGSKESVDAETRLMPTSCLPVGIM